MTWHLQRTIGPLTLVVATLMWAAPCATGDPAGDGGAVLEAPTLSLSDLGSSSTISFYVNQDVTSTSVDFPVPQGLTPVALNATLELPTSLRFGRLSVTQNDRTISRLELPPEDQAAIIIPLVGAQISGNHLSVTLTLSAVANDGYCWNSLSPIRLVNASATFTGTESAPTTVAEFLPPVLRRLTIAVPSKPSQPESDAAVQLAAAMTTQYSGQNPELVVVPLPEGATTLPNPSAPMERQIVIKEGPDKGLSLQDNAVVPALLISGQGNELTNQTRLLSDASLRFALSRKTFAGTLSNEPKLAPATTTLEQLNGSGLSSETLWPSVGIDIDQSRFGHSLQGVRVHLIGSQTPLPNDFGGDVTASVGGETIDRWQSPADGTIDRWVSIPDRLIKRSMTLQISVHTTGNPGHCGDYLPMALKMDGSTTIQTGVAETPVPPGFQSLPEALMSPVQIGIGADAFDDTVRAVQIAAGLQHMSGAPLTTTVTSLQQATDSHHAAVLISSNGWTDKTVPLPFGVDEKTVTVQGLDAKGEPITLTLDPGLRAGSLQTVFDGKRSLLIATSNGAPAQLDDLLRWLSGERGRWSGLSGRAIFSIPGNDPVTVPNPPTDFWAAEPSNDGNENGLEWWIVGGVAALAAVGALIILLRTRRSTVRPTPNVVGGSQH